MPEGTEGDDSTESTTETLAKKVEEFASRVEESEKRAEEAEQRVKEADEAREAAETSARELEAKLSADGMTLEKGGLPEAVQKRIRDAEERAEVAERKATEERAERLDGEWIAKISSLDKLTGDPAQLGPALRRFAEVDADAVNELQKVLTGANEALSQVALFAEVGHMVEVTGTAEQKLDALAKVHAQKENVTYEQAYAAVVKTDAGKALYEQYREEM